LSALKIPLMAMRSFCVGIAWSSVVSWAPATAQIVLLEDDFEDGVIDPALWEVYLPYSDSSAVETGGVLRLTNRAWLMSATTLGGLGEDIAIEGEITPEIISGPWVDNWYVWMYSNFAPGGCCGGNQDGLVAVWFAGGTSVGGVGEVACATVSGPSPGGGALGFRLSALGGQVSYEMWNLANPTDYVIVQSSLTKMPAAGERVFFYNREYIGQEHVTLLDNVRVYRLDCNGNGILDSVDIAAGTSQDCNMNGAPDECDIAYGISSDANGDGVPDECQVQVSDVGHVLSFSSDPVIITGGEFDATTTVLLDGAPTLISSWTASTVTIHPAPANPDLLDLTVTNSVSTKTIPDGLALWPTLAATTTGVGGDLDLTVWNGIEGIYVLAVGSGALPAPFPIGSPPTWYGVLLDVSGPVVLVDTGAFATAAPVALSYPIPDVPAWAGISLYFQAWCQQGFFGTGVTYSFTNEAGVTF
jgi:hypothetical protein